MLITVITLMVTVIDYINVHLFNLNILIVINDGKFIK